MIWAAIFLFLMILLIGLGLDSAKGFLVAHQLQNAADAAALAGAQIVKLDPNEARLRAIEVAKQNCADGNAVQLKDNPQNLPDGDVVIGRYDRYDGRFTPTLHAANAVKVVARRLETSLGGPVPINFAPIAGVHAVNIERYAIAMASGGTGAGVICLRPDDVGFLANGNLAVTVIDVNEDGRDEGTIRINSSADDAAHLIGTPILIADGLDVWGDLSSTGGINPSDFAFPIDTDAPPMPDPLCPDPFRDCIPPPFWDAANDLGNGETVQITDGAHVFTPGYYSGGFRITGGDVTFAPGIYVLGGSSAEQKAGLVVLGNATLCAKGVMFFITGDGVLDLGGTGAVRIAPPESGNTDFCDPGFASPAGLDYENYAGVSIFQDRDNFNDAHIRGTSLMDLDGTIYFPKNHLDLTGTGSGFGNQLIAWSVEVSGTGNILIKYDGRNRTPGNSSYLVE
jgi:hypothetical protein